MVCKREKRKNKERKEKSNWQLIAWKIQNFSNDEKY